MLEITRKNCYKCNLETIIDNNSQYFWINLRDFEVETERKWLNMFNKHGNKSPMKYRRELTDRIFVRNDLFEQVIKSCKATNGECLMFKEKLGTCPCEENYYEEGIIKIQDDIEETDEEPIEVIGKVSNEKSTKKLTKELIAESDEESISKSFEESAGESDEMFKELTKIKSPNKDKNTTDWYDKNKFNKTLTTIDNNVFNHKNKIGKLKFNHINDLVNNIKNTTISEADAKKKINKLNEIKIAETKNKHLINGQKVLLSLFDELLKAIFNNNNSNSNKNSNNKSNNNSNNNESNNNSNNKSNNNESNSKNENENESENKSENDNDECE